MSSARVERHVTGRIEPVVALQGPRAVGKTTLLRAVAQVSNSTVLDLDDPAIRAAVEADPVTFVSGPGPVFIDEYQHVPMILAAIKAELNRDGSPGRFAISGSTRRQSSYCKIRAKRHTAIASRQVRMVSVERQESDPAERGPRSL